MDYGIDGSRRIAAEEGSRILELGRSRGMDTLDTASGYGDSEEVLGHKGVDEWRVVSKVPPVPRDGADAREWVVTCASESLKRLRIPALHGLLLHRAADLLEPWADGVYAGLRDCQERGWTRKVGISIYGPEELAAIMPRYPLSLVQAPFNVVDRRLRDSGWLDRLKDAGAEIHARSLFLQGLLLMPAAVRPRAFSRWDFIWNTWEEWLRAHGSSALAACLGFVLADARIDRAVVGVATRAQLHEILDGLVEPCLSPPAALASDDADLVNPSHWNVR
jgi:aryl-alcohol dehydrogenase-like predicted oxidoreductase